MTTPMETVPPMPWPRFTAAPFFSKNWPIGTLPGSHAELSAIQGHKALTLLGYLGTTPAVGETPIESQG